MVYLVRKCRVTGTDWSRMESVSRALVAHWSKSPEVKRVEAWSNIAGRQDEFRFVALFDSLADEEKFATRLSTDSSYEKVMMDFLQLFDLGEDQLYRTFE
jgi:hypothetical protein